jgi:hypothetical protein
MIVNSIRNVFREHVKTLVSNEEFVELTLNVLLRTVKLRVFVFQDILETQDQCVKSLVLFHVRKILAELTVIVLIHQTAPNASANLAA